MFLYFFIDEYVFLRRGLCDSSDIGGHHQDSVRECYDECMTNPDIKYFAYIGKTGNNENCKCFKIQGGCTPQTSAADYNVYEINPGI